MTLTTGASVALESETEVSKLNETDTLLKTKLSVPLARSTLVPRDHLIARLDDGLQRGRRLTLVSAPAGFGKTTLLSAWLRHLADMSSAVTDPVAHAAPIGVAWLALDPEDNQPMRFWMYLVGALQTIASDVGQEAQRLLAMPRRPPIRTALSSLLNDLAAYSQVVILVLDDYQIITATAIHKSLAFLVDHAPPQLHIVVSSRADPPLPLIRLRARDQLTELRVTELCFTLEETAAFLTTMTGMHWSPDEMLPLRSSTEGWIVGLQIAGLELQRLLAISSTTHSRREILRYIYSFSGHHRDIRDFLEEEVLKHQSEHIQAFLMLTSILERLNGSLCDTVTGQTGSRAVLEQLEKANLFLVPLDGVRYWYRYHAMFADVLQCRLHQAQPDLVPILHRRAAEWYEDQGYADEAIAHRLRAKHIDLAIQSGDQSWMHMLHIGMIELAPTGSNVMDAHISPDAANDVGRALTAPYRVDEGLPLPASALMAQDHLLGEEQNLLLSALPPRHVVVQLVEQLTERELAILQLMLEGLTYIEISEQLVISLNTVRFHVKNMYGKLGVHHRIQAIARAKDLGLLTE